MNAELVILKALSDRNRLRIVAALERYEELCACQITEFLHVTGATASRHLGVLHRAGLLDSRKQGRWVFYRLAPPAEMDAIFKWLECASARSEWMQDDAVALEKIVGIAREDLCRQQRGEACCPK